MTIYDLKPGAKSLTYDDQFMIFGNSEIRLRFKEEAVYCNFAIQNANFNN
jgi:hypothetical protein